MASIVYLLPLLFLFEHFGKLIANDVTSFYNVTSLRLMQYNVEWLFIDYYANMDCPGNGCTWHSHADAETHMSYVVNVLKDLNPDIVNFCEIEGTTELNMLNSQLNNSYRPYFIKGTDTGTGQNVGMLSKIEPFVSLYRTEEKISYPLSGNHCGTTSASGKSGVSKHYITEFKFGSLDVAFIGVHLLAFPADPSRCVQRESQAQVIYNVVNAYVEKGYEIILMGDMNDFDEEIMDINFNKPTSRALRILKGLENDTYTLHNIAEHIPQMERYSDWWDSDKNCSTSSQKDVSMIDHVLMSPNIAKHVTNVFIYHKYSEYCGKWDSDHWPVVVDLNL